MKKGKYIDIYVIMACLSHQKPKTNLQGINELLNNACAESNKPICENECPEPVLLNEETVKR
jgi:hypothetical protein